MLANTAISNFEKKLESAIKNTFESAFRQEEYFEIAADYDTESRLDGVLKGLDLNVYGMSVAPSQFTITLEFSGLYESMECIAKPMYCCIHLENSGAYSFNLSKNDLKNNWHLSITDVFFNAKVIPEEVLLETLKQMEKVLFFKVLSKT